MRNPFRRTKAAPERETQARLVNISLPDGKTWWMVVPPPDERYITYMGASRIPDTPEQREKNDRREAERQAHIKFYQDEADRLNGVEG